MWKCSLCTLLNQPESKSCGACCNARPDSHPIWTCASCTFTNSHRGSICEMCAKSRTDIRARANGEQSTKRRKPKPKQAIINSWVCFECSTRNDIMADVCKSCSGYPPPLDPQVRDMLPIDHWGRDPWSRQRTNPATLEEMMLRTGLLDGPPVMIKEGPTEMTQREEIVQLCSGNRGKTLGSPGRARSKTFDHVEMLQTSKTVSNEPQLSESDPIDMPNVFSENGGWKCGLCTFVNKRGDTSCEMCQNAFQELRSTHRWQCDRCAYTNHETRQSCGRCKQRPTPTAATVTQSVTTNHWNCGRCAYKNHGGRLICGHCKYDPTDKRRISDRKPEFRFSKSLTEESYNKSAKLPSRNVRGVQTRIIERTQELHLSASFHMENHNQSAKASQNIPKAPVVNTDDQGVPVSCHTNNNQPQTSNNRNDERNAPLIQESSIERGRDFRCPASLRVNAAGVHECPMCHSLHPSVGSQHTGGPDPPF